MILPYINTGHENNYELYVCNNDVFDGVFIKQINHTRTIQANICIM